jgi:hypothetical protein
MFGFDSNAVEARDPKRVERMLELIGELWRKYPQLRLGQLLVNVEHRFTCCAFSIEDEEVEAAMRKVLSQGGFGG